MYRDWQIAKSALDNEETSEQAQQEYSKVAQWCCDGQEYRIVEDGDYYKVEPIPEPTAEEKAQNVRAIRDNYLTKYVDAVVSNPLRWADLTEEEQEKIKAYRHYLLDIPQSEGFPDVEVKTFEEWEFPYAE